MLFIAIVLAIVCLEAVLKGYIEKHAQEYVTKKKMGGFLQITKYHNDGAFLNILEKHPGLLKWISLLLSAALTVLFVITLGKTGNKLLKTGLAMLLGGAYSNTYDRLFRKYVVDYFSIHIPVGPFKKLSKIVFNVADFFVMIGAMLTVIASY